MERWSNQMGKSKEAIDMCGGVKGTLQASWEIWCVNGETKYKVADNIGSESVGWRMVALLRSVSNNDYDVVLGELPEIPTFGEGERVWEVIDIKTGEVHWRGLGYINAGYDSYKTLSQHPKMAGKELDWIGEWQDW